MEKSISGVFSKFLDDTRIGGVVDSEEGRLKS